MGLRGSLAELPLSDLIEMISLGGKTGLLVLSDDRGEVAGELAFRAGRLAGAVCGELSGERAFYALTALRHGEFDFDPTAELDEATFDLSTQSLLMEAMRRVDETRRLRLELPAPATVRRLWGEPLDQLEACLLDLLGSGERIVGDIVEGLLVGGEADEYDALRTLHRLAARGVISVDAPPGVAETDHTEPGEAPQPELER